MKILVLGGTGAMGIPVVKFLAANDNEVHVTSRKKIESSGHIHYVEGNAHDLNFVKGLLRKKYDVLVDFMVYSEDEFEERIDLLLGSVGQYIFLSSARVYAGTEDELTEESDRILDVCIDDVYLQTKEYALEKAREENIIRGLKHKNWTIIRPYITFNYNRLQLGVLEKEYWLQRALKGKTIVFSKEIASKYTTMTFGDDVSRHIAKLAGNENAYGEIFHITNDQAVKWSEILDCYEKVINRETGRKVKIKLTDDDEGVAWCFGCYYQIHYDRCYNRKFSSSKINYLTQDSDYKDTLEELEHCLTEFIHSDQSFLCVNWKLEGYFDRLTKEKTCLSEIDSLKHKIAYFICRYTPYVDWSIRRARKLRSV